MSDDFKYQCRRRSTRPHPVTETVIAREEQLLGAGSGGGPGDGSVAHYNDALFNVHSEEVFFHASSDQESGGCISLLAEGVGCGTVSVHGSEGVRITSGPPGQPPAYHEGIHGLEVAVGDEQYIQVTRGTIPGANQGLLMTASSYNLLASAARVAITSDTSITLSVAGGLSQIMLTPSGIVIKGLVVQIN